MFSYVVDVFAEKSFMGNPVNQLTGTPALKYPLELCF